MDFLTVPVDLSFEVILRPWKILMNYILLIFDISYFIETVEIVFGIIEFNFASNLSPQSSKENIVEFIS